MKRILFASFFVALAAFAIHAQSSFTINDLINVKRVTDPQLAPDQGGAGL